MNQLTPQQQVCQQIMFGNFTNDELNGIAQAIQFARANITKANIRSLRAGASVQFTSSRSGKNITGEVVKVGRKFVVVREHGMNFGNWRVPANMLEVI